MLWRCVTATATNTSAAAAITVDQFWLIPQPIDTSRMMRPANPHAKQAIRARAGVVRIAESNGEHRSPEAVEQHGRQVHGVLLRDDHVGERYADRQNGEQEDGVDDALNPHQ